MKVKAIITANDLNNEGFVQLKRSLDHYGWDYHVITENYIGLGSKWINAYNYAKQSDCTHFFMLDAYDTFVLGTMEDAIFRIPNIDGMFFNAEKNCFPDSEKAYLYAQNNSEWKYVNSGCGFIPKSLLIQLFEQNTINHTDNDQRNLTDIFLKNKYQFELDYNCELFQTLFLEKEGDFGLLLDTFTNRKTASFPIIIHGNGKSNMDRVYNLLK